MSYRVKPYLRKSHGMRPIELSITHKSGSDMNSQLNIRQAR